MAWALVERMNKRMMARRELSRAGFSLVELSVILLILGLMFGGIMMLGDKWTEAESQKAIGLQVKTAENALHNFVRLNNRLPCPADPDLPATDASFGREMRDGSSGCDDSGGVNEFAGAGGDTVAKGALPFVSLNLTAAQMYDESGAMKQYYVDESMTLEDATIQDVDPADLDNIGGIVIQDASGSARAARATYALVSYGTEVNEGAATGDEAENQNDDATLVQSIRRKGFDDVVTFGTFRQLSSVIDSAMGGESSTATGPFFWNSDAWSTCSAENPTYSAWSACSASPYYSYGLWGSCSASPYYSYGSWSACSASPSWGGWSSWSSCSGGSCSCSTSWGSAYYQYTGGDTLDYYGGSCPSCPGGYMGCCGCWSGSGSSQTTAKNWRSCGNGSGGSGTGWCCYDRYQRDATTSCSVSSYGTKTRYRSCYGTSGTQTRSYSCVNTSGTQTRSYSCDGTTGTQTRTCTAYSGSQTRKVWCEDAGGNTVGDSYCAGAGAKPATSQSCSSTCGATTQNCTESCPGSPVTTQSCTKSCPGSPYTSQSCTGSCYGSSSESTSCTPSC